MMILISRAAAVAIFSEVQRWVELGLEQAGAPYESLVYPLSALVPAGHMITPLEPVELSGLQAAVIDSVAIPPDRIKSFSVANCHFAAEDLEAANLDFNRQIDRQLAAHPRLGVHSKLHSHPFAGGNFLSDGDVRYGVTSPRAAAWRRNQGLGTAILHVAYPDHQPRSLGRPWRIDGEGALASGAGRWRIRSWASLPDGELLDLGDAKVVAEGHPLLRAARRPPYWCTRQGGRWCDAQKAALRQAGYTVSRNLLGRGWRRYLVRAGGRQLLFGLPPDLPAAAPRVLEVRNALQGDFEALPLPAGLRPRRRLGDLSLLALARHFGEPDR